MKKKRLMSCMMAGLLLGMSLTGCGGSDGQQEQENASAESNSDKPFAGQEITFADTGAGDWEDTL